MDKIIIPNWPAPKSVHALTTTRLIGNSQRFLLSNHRGDSADLVSANRQLLMSQLHLPSEPVWLAQVHGTNVVDAALTSPESEADASYTDQENIVCVVMTADCVPILLCHPSGDEVAAIHAGWRGLAAGVIEETVQRFKSSKSHIMAWLGPAIGPTAFEVGDEVREQFMHYDAKASAAFIAHKPGKWMGNLYQLATQRLNDWGVTQVYGGSYCTFSQPDLFFSYRRDHGQTGSLASMIWRENPLGGA